MWSYSQEEHFKNEERNLIYWGKDGLSKVPSFKRYKHMLRNADGVVPTTWWRFEEVGHNDSAKKELMAVLPDHARSFSTPKPSTLIERILTIGADKEDLILDFFAGSGTTAHAVLKLNMEDGGKRRFILVSSTEATAEEPQKNLCRDVCAERVRRAITGNGETPGLGGNFAYLRTRRIAPERMLEIDHAQVWTALQLMHRGTLAPAPETSIYWAGDEEAALLYLPEFRPNLLPALRAKAKESAAVILYSWQPGYLRQRMCAAHVQHEGIPEALLRKFNLRRRG